MKKRLLSMILAISMVLTFLPVSAISAFAADESSTQPMSGNCGYYSGIPNVSNDTVKYTLIQNNKDNDNPTYILKIEGSGAMASYSSAENVPWNSYRTSITEVEIGENVESICDYAFQNCALTSIHIPDSVEYMGYSVFADCSSLNSVTGMASVKNINFSTFKKCVSLTTISIPNGVTRIWDDAFSGCTSLTSINIPDGVTNVGSNAFSGSGLTSINIPDSVKYMDHSVFAGCSSLSSVTGMASVTNISAAAFKNCVSLTAINIPNGVAQIYDDAFSGCTSLTSIHIPDTVTEIGDNAFKECINLKTVTGMNGVNQIGGFFGSTFYGCKALTSIHIPDSVVTIKPKTFAYSGLTSVTGMKNVTSIANAMFYECTALESVPVMKNLITIEGNAFYDCKQLTKVTIPDSVTTIEYGAFSGCSSLTSVTIPDSVTTIEIGAFSGCSSLTSVTIPDKITTIARSVFSDCTNLTEVILPKEVPSILDDVFERDYNLKIYYPYSKAEWEAQPNVTSKNISGLARDGVTLAYTHTSVPICYLCDVTFDANGGTLASTMPTGPVKVYRTEYVTNTKANKLISIDAPTRTGYTFAGWYTSATPQENDTAFDLAATAVQDDMTLYAAWTANGCTLTVPENCTVKDADTGDEITVGADHKANVKYDQKITITAPELADGDAYEWVNGETTETGTGNEYTFTVAGDTAIECNLLKALHITNDGKPNTTGTKYDADKRTYYGNGWEYSETAGLTIKADKDLSNEPAVTVNVTVETGKTVSNAKLEGSVTNNGTLRNCVLDKAPTGGTVENSLFGAEYTGAHTLTEADGKNITAKLDGVKDGSLTGKTLWFVGTPKLTATVENAEIKHINHTAVTESGITGIDGNVTANADHSVTFTPDGNENILLNNRTAESGDFTFTTPEDCTYDGNVHKVDDITSTTYMDGEYTVKYDYKKPDGTPGDETEEPKNAGTYTVKIVMSDGQTIDTGKSFTIKPAEPGKDDFEFVKDLPSGVTEDRDDSEKTAEVKLKSDSLFQKNGAGVEQEYQKKNADGEWEKVTAPSGKGEYKLVATVTTTDPNLTGGTVEWEFTILDREDANWLTMSVEDGKITKVTRPAADDAEAEEDITEKVLLTASADGSKTAYKVPAGAQVTVTANDAPQDMKFEMWRFSVNSMNGDTTLALYSRSMTFTLKDDVAGLTVSAMYQDAAIDSGYDILGPAAAATTAVVGSAILAYQGHMLGTELYLIYLLPSGAVIPANRIQLAMLLWQDAGNPAPVDETLYTDIDANDTDAMQAAQWAVETGLMELPDADSAPDQFDPYAAVSNVDVIHAWKKAQKVKG